MIRAAEPAISEQFDRLPPHDLDAEMSTLASLALCGDDVNLFQEIADEVTREDFYQADNQIIFDVLIGLRKRGAVDATLLHAELSRRGLIDEVGGAGYIAQILNSVPSHIHGPHYAKIVQEKAIWRGLIAASNEMIRRAYAGSKCDSADEAGNAHMADVAKVVQRSACTSLMPIGELVKAAYDRMEEIATTGEIPLVPTGYGEIDDVTGGFGQGEMIVLAARPSMGKSTLARQIAVRSARMGTPVGVISLEEDRHKLARNWLSAAASVENQKIRKAQLNQEEWARAADGVTKLTGLPIVVEDRAFTLAQVKSAAVRLVARHGIKLLIIDYLQKIQVPGRDRFDKVTTASLEISSMLKEQQLAGLVLSQLNRGNEQRTDKRPCMSDLRESGQIEQDADGILMLHREDYYRATDPARRAEPSDQVAEVIIAKFRDGVRGRTIKLKSELRFQRFEDGQAEVPEGI